MPMMMRKQKGLSLIEIIVALALSAAIAYAVLLLFTDSFYTSQRILDKGKLDRDLNSLMTIIVSDIQRAGYYSNATNSSTNNPFMLTNNIATNSSCVTFSYDRNTDGTLSDTDKFGYRFSGSSSSNLIQSRPAGSTTDCTAAYANWTNITDPNVLVITAFSISQSNIPLIISNNTTNNSTTNVITYRAVNITISGYLKNDPTFTKTITRTIKVYNSKYTP